MKKEISEKLRKNFGHFATGIAIAATVNKKGAFNSITVNSLSSLSLEPPLILFCIDNKSENLKAFKTNKYFTLNILSEDQEELSREFAKSENQTKFEIEPYGFSKFGCHFFTNSMGYFECERKKTIKVGDHHIIIGKVIDFVKLNNKNPLIYFQGQYNSIFIG